MKNLALLASFILVFFLISCGPKKEKTEDQKSTDNEIGANSLDTNKSYSEFVENGLSDTSAVKKDTSKIDNAVYTDPSKGIQIDPPVNVKKEVVPVKETHKEAVKTHVVKYYIVAGSFKKYSNAQNLKAYFKKKGYKPRILPKSGGYSRVAIVSYPGESEARKSIKKLRVDNNDITFWLYKW